MSCDISLNYSSKDIDFLGDIVATHDVTTGCGIGGTNNMDRGFDYDAIYRLLSANGRENAPTTTFPWDDTYRSTNDGSTTAYTQNYAYDKLGNIQSLQHIGGASFTRNFNYSSTTNKLNSVTVGLTTYTFTYDACGNQLTETSSRNWEWDHNDKPRCFYVKAGSSITQYTQYLYSAGGQRVKKFVWTAGGNYNSYTYIDGVFEYRTDNVGNQQNILHVMDNRSRIATQRIGYAFGDTTPAIKFNLEDQIGSSVVLLDNGGSNVNYEEYYPFGETSFGSYALKRYKYCGKERDEESGLYYYGARYYSPWICRFVSVDPLAAKTAFQSPYAYANNNPIKLNDPSGMEAENPQASENIEPKSSNLPVATEPTKENSTTEKTDLSKVGEAWKHKHKWNDVITDKKDIKKYGEGFEKGKTTYKDLYEKIAPKILGDKLVESQEKGLKMDCADLVLNTLVDFASEFGLPVYMKDFRPDGKTFDSTSTTFKSKTEFAQALKSTFGAATLFSEANKALNTIDWKDIQPGDIMSWKYYIWPWQDESTRSWHANTITDVTAETITVIQGSLHENSATPIEGKTYDRESNGKVDGPWDIKEVKARRWNFNSFDRKK